MDTPHSHFPMQRHAEITRQRLQNFVGRIREQLYRRHEPLTPVVYSAPGRISFAEAQRGAYRPARVGESFGPLWSTHWFKLECAIPTDWAGAEVHLLWNSTSEGCVWEDGVPLQGLTGSGTQWVTGGDRPLRGDYCLTKSAHGGERRLVYVEMACNTLFGDPMEPSHRAVLGQLRQAAIAVFDRQAWDLLWDFVIIADLAQQLPVDSPRAGQALYAANQMVNLCRLDDRKTWRAARAVAAKFFAARNGDSQHHVSAIGHAHIDTAWLWPLAETVRKCYRTFATAVRLMDDYPDYKFACSQAQQYDWIKQQQPALYAKIKQRVAEGRFVPAGGTWIEPDCNIPTGESLVRQFLYGQRFFQKEFGITCAEFWNPDVFGYCGQLPQIMRGAGIRYFLTQKLSWNQFNKPAHHTFLWEGLDGSRVLTHFPPADTYNGVGTAKELLFNVKNFKDHDRANESYYLFGYGDGGGGPTTEMLEQLHRMRDLDGLPRVAQRAPSEFFARCEADIQDPTVWVGELYFEMHRGTYTTQARNKLFNRRSEELLHDVEFLSAVAGTRGARYPRQELDRLWKLVLLNQFHDIIPGSSICEVYEDSQAQYRDILASAEKLRTQAIAALLPAAPAGPRLLAINTLGCPRTEVVDVDGQPAVLSAPAMGYAIQNKTGTKPAQAVTVTEAADTFTLENQFVRVRFGRDGQLVSLFDKWTQREAIELGKAANHFVLFDDEPNAFDAWDVDVFHLEKRLEVGAAKSARTVEQNPLRVTLEFAYDLTARSRLTQRVSLTAISPRLDFATETDWQEHRRFLKVEFPCNVRADHATYEIQFGHLPRPTHFNTTWDLARFEVCAHRWADLSEPGFGVALLNDCKYGHAAQRNVLRLSLLRATTYPDLQADRGQHRFRYALLPHGGDFRQAGVVAEAARFNVPLLVRPTDAGPTEVSFFSVDNPVVVIDTVKQAEDSDALIVRLYEAHGTRGRVRLRSPLPVRSVTRCDLLEQDTGALTWSNGGVDMEVAPLQIVTLKLNP